MNRITNVKGSRARRAYTSPLRDERAEDTRRRILDGLVRTMSRGVTELSIPAVADESGVSVPTVYRHFRTKADLVAALSPYLAEKSRLMEIPSAAPGDVGTLVRELYARHAALAPEVRAAMASDLGGVVRRQNMPRRIAMIREALRKHVPGIARDDLERLTRTTLILMATPTIRAFKDYLDLDPAPAAEDVAWALERIVRSVRRKRS